MAASATLTRLLRDLKSVSSPLERMRVAARAWRSLRQLRPDERKILAAQVGLEGAEDILEGLGRGEKRLAPVLVLRALEKAKKADPSQLRGLVKGLRDRDTRGAILQKWLDSVSEGLEEQEAEEQEDAPPEAAPEQPLAPTPPASSKRTERDSAPPKAIPVAAPVAAIPVASALPLPSSKPEPRAKPAAITPERKPSRRVPPAVPLPVPVPVARKKPTEAKPVSPAPPRPALPAGELLADRLHHTDGLMARFRQLRGALDGDGHDRLGDLGRLLEAFPDGWARRRALVALLQHRIPAKLLQALALVNQLESTSARRWCLGTILEHWKLTKEQQEQLRRRRSFN